MLSSQEVVSQQQMSQKTLSGKTILGAKETIEIEEANLAYLSRIDTGASTTSLHARNILIEGQIIENIDIEKALASKDIIGKFVQFTTSNKKNGIATVESKVADIMRVKTSEGQEIRVMVPLTLKWNDKSITVNVNLNDRSRMRHPLLVGRNFIKQGFLVDVTK